MWLAFLNNSCCTDMKFLRSCIIFYLSEFKLLHSQYPPCLLCFQMFLLCLKLFIFIIDWTFGFHLFVRSFIIRAVIPIAKGIWSYIWFKWCHGIRLGSPITQRFSRFTNRHLFQTLKTACTNTFVNFLLWVLSLLNYWTLTQIYNRRWIFLFHL